MNGLHNLWPGYVSVNFINIQINVILLSSLPSSSSSSSQFFVFFLLTTPLQWCTAGRRNLGYGLALSASTLSIFKSKSFHYNRYLFRRRRLLLPNYSPAVVYCWTQKLRHTLLRIQHRMYQRFPFSSLWKRMKFHMHLDAFYCQEFCRSILCPSGSFNFIFGDYSSNVKAMHIMNDKSAFWPGFNVVSPLQLRGSRACTHLFN